MEVDVLCETVAGFIGLEIKAISHWKKRYSRGLVRIREELGKSKVRTYGIYTGERDVLVDGIQIMTWQNFLKRLWHGDIIT